MNLANILGSPRTTFASLWTVVVFPTLLGMVPKVAAFFGSQPGLLWTLLAAGLTLVVPALLPDAKAAPALAAK